MCAFAALAAEPIDIGSHRELFADRYPIDKLIGAEHKSHHPVPRKISLRFDKPWERLFSTYATVIEDDGLYRLYYRGTVPGPGAKEALLVTCNAESRDGITG